MWGGSVVVAILGLGRGGVAGDGGSVGRRVELEVLRVWVVGGIGLVGVGHCGWEGRFGGSKKGGLEMCGTERSGSYRYSGGSRDEVKVVS